jgi:hypothetical protein
MDSWSFSGDGKSLPSPPTSPGNGLPLHPADFIPTDYSLFLEGLKAWNGNIDENSVSDSLDEREEEYVPNHENVDDDDDEEEEESEEDDDDDEDEDEDDGEEDEVSLPEGATPTQQQQPTPFATALSPSDQDGKGAMLGSDLNTPSQTKASNNGLDNELADLLSEDIEAADRTDNVLHTSALTNHFTLPPLSTAANGNNSKAIRPYIPLSGNEAPVAVTTRQYEFFQKLLQSHHQLLISSCAMSVREALDANANANTNTKLTTTNPPSSSDVQAMCLKVTESSASMLSTLADCRHAAIRASLKYRSNNAGGSRLTPGSVPERSRNNSVNESSAADGRITRATFNKLVSSDGGPLDDVSNSMNTASNIGRNTDGRVSAFEVPGISRTNVVIRQLDGSVDASTASIRRGSVLDKPNDAETTNEMLKLCGITPNPDYLPIPPNGDYNAIFTEQFPTCATIETRRFTRAEDQLLLSAVAELGERQFHVVSERYLPNRTTHALNQRHSFLLKRLCDDRVAKGGPVVMQNTPAGEDNVDHWLSAWDTELFYAYKLKGNQWAILSSLVLPWRNRSVVRQRIHALERKFKNVEGRDGVDALLGCSTILEDVAGAKKPSSSSSSNGLGSSGSGGGGISRRRSMDSSTGTTTTASTSTQLKKMASAPPASTTTQNVVAAAATILKQPSVPASLPSTVTSPPAAPQLAPPQQPPQQPPQHQQQQQQHPPQVPPQQSPAPPPAALPQQQPALPQQMMTAMMTQMLTTMMASNPAMASTMFQQMMQSTMLAPQGAQGGQQLLQQQQSMAQLIGSGMASLAASVPHPPIPAQVSAAKSISRKSSARKSTGGVGSSAAPAPAAPAAAAAATTKQRKAKAPGAAAKGKKKRKKPEESTEVIASGMMSAGDLLRSELERSGDGWGGDFTMGASHMNMDDECSMMAVMKKGPSQSLDTFVAEKGIFGNVIDSANNRSNSSNNGSNGGFAAPMPVNKLAPGALSGGVDGNSVLSPARPPATPDKSKWGADDFISNFSPNTNMELITGLQFSEQSKACFGSNSAPTAGSLPGFQFDSVSLMATPTKEGGGGATAASRGQGVGAVAGGGGSNKSGSRGAREEGGGGGGGGEEAGDGGSGKRSLFSSVTSGGGSGTKKRKN